MHLPCLLIWMYSMMCFFHLQHYFWTLWYSLWAFITAPMQIVPLIEELGFLTQGVIVALTANWPWAQLGTLTCYIVMWGKWIRQQKWYHPTMGPFRGPLWRTSLVSQLGFRLATLWAVLTVSLFDGILRSATNLSMGISIVQVNLNHQ